MTRRELLYKKLYSLSYIELDDLYLIVCESFYNDKIIDSKLREILVYSNSVPIIEGEQIKQLCVNRINNMLKQMTNYSPNILLGN